MILPNSHSQEEEIVADFLFSQLVHPRSLLRPNRREMKVQNRIFAPDHLTVFPPAGRILLRLQLKHRPGEILN